MWYLSQVWLIFIHIASTTVCESASDEQALKWDKRGYVIFCPCMGRFGNQADHFLGALAFAKSLDRTLVLPPWRTYKNIPFNEWFQIEPLEKFHRVVLAEDFMKQLAPSYWPVGKRSGWCWLPPDSDKKCAMKEGNPFGPFWDGLGVDFDDYVIYHISYDEYNLDQWKSEFPPEKYPVMAFKGAPARFPVLPNNRPLHKYLQWSDAINNEAQDYIDKTFGEEKFVGIHLRNGVDWVNACNHADGMSTYMASPQCLAPGEKVTSELCLPSQQGILNSVKDAVISTGAKHVFVATDKNPMVMAIEKALKQQKVTVHHLDPYLPQIDLCILGKADHFIGSCVSSFTAFVKRERDVNGKTSSFFGQR